MFQPHEKTKKPELLAPAGSLEAFFAAMEKGADAVYTGLREFSARAKAKNFSLSQMERMVAYAHSLNRRVYITLNTLVKEDELPRLVETLSALEAMGADGVILQDLGVARLIRDHFPGLPRHASTQMTIHNLPGVRMLEDLGFERVVLARELHIDDIRHICRESTAEIECFIHGALCFAISGQCYFSSFLGGHSGNRGRCAQPCRRHYRHRGKEGYFFSTNDLSAIDLIPEMAAAGVASLKIEGRMKSAEYVASVVEAYRLILDAPERKRADAAAQAKELLKLSFGRVPTKGFLASRTPGDIAIPTLRGATGRFLGEIKAIRGDRITFETKDRLFVGDRVRVQPRSDMAGKAFTVKEIVVGKERVKSAKERSLVTVTTPFAFKVGDAVFKVSSETAFTMSENACLKRLEAVKPGKIPCDLALSLQDGTLRIAARAGGASCDAAFPLGDLEPSRTADMAGVLNAQFSRTGDTPFELRSLEAPGFPAVLIPSARLKEVRREFYRQLGEQVVAGVAKRRAEARRRALAALVQPGPVRRAARPEVTVRIEQLRDVAILRQPGVDAVILPVSRANLHQLPQSTRKLRGDEGRVTWHIPFIIFDADIPFYTEAISTLVEQGFRRFELANLSHLAMLKGRDVEISTDFRLFSVNSQALLSWRELGATAATLYIEDDAGNMAALLAADVPVRRSVLVYGAVPAMTTRIDIKGAKGDAPVVSDRGDEYEVAVRGDLTTITPTTRFSLTHFRSRLLEMGCGSFVIDLSQAPREQWRPILDAFARGDRIPGTSEFNFTTGLV
ncbi:MAG: U32 family peptidase [Desulfuromonadales bacterium]|nr:MAG: U32 family peptidase [Desulfuromonadales bacterium]